MRSAARSKDRSEGGGRPAGPSPAKFADRGVHHLNGIPDEWQLFAARDEIGGEV